MSQRYEVLVRRPAGFVDADARHHLRASPAEQRISAGCQCGAKQIDIVGKRRCMIVRLVAHARESTRTGGAGRTAASIARVIRPKPTAEQPRSAKLESRMVIAIRFLRRERESA